MDVYTLARTPLFLFSLIITGLVVGWGLSIAIRTLVQKAVSATLVAQIDQQEFLALDLTHLFQNQHRKLLERISLVEELGAHIPSLLEDVSWNKLSSLCDLLESAQQRLSELLQTGDTEEAIALARFLSTGKASSANLSAATGTARFDELRSWHPSSTALLQRIIARGEDFINHGATQEPHLSSKDASTILNRLRNLVAADEYKASSRTH